MALVLAVVPSVARAHHLDDPPLIASWATTGNDYVALKLFVPAEAEWETAISIDQLQARMVGFGIFDSGGWFAGVQWTNDQRIHVESRTSGTLLNSGDPQFDREDFTDKISYGGMAYRDGIYDIVMMFAMDGTMTGSLDVRGTDGVAILGMTRGSASLIHDEQFGGAAHARGSERVAYVPFVGCVGCATAQATVGAEAHLEVQHSLYGWFGAGIGASGIEGPPGSSGDDLFGGEPPGHYRFHIEATVGDEPTWLLTADVEAPS